MLTKWREMATTDITHWKWAGLTAFSWFFAWILLLAAFRPEYRNATKAISELGAVGAPNMLLMNLFGFAGTGMSWACSPLAIVREWDKLLRDTGRSC